MKNKNLQTLLRTIADQQNEQPQQEDSAEIENLGQELAAKLKGGVGTGDSNDTTVNNGCNFGC